MDGYGEHCVQIVQSRHPDVIEMDAASHSKVDETREILSGVPLATAGGRRKVYVIDEVHMLSTPSFNALLKTLEEPPAHVLFVLATTEAHKVLATIVSRTQRFDFRRVPAELIEEHLAKIAKLEGIDIDPEAIAVVARHADGGVRDALSTLDQLASLQGPIGARDVQALLGNRREDAFAEIFDAIAAGDVGSVFLSLHILLSEGADPRQLALGALAHARTLLLLKTAPEGEGLLDVAAEDIPRLLEQAGRFQGGLVLRILDLLAKALTEMRNVPDHRLLLELALVRAAAPETDPSANGLLGRIERLERRSGIEHEDVQEVRSAPAAPARPRRAPADPAPVGGKAPAPGKAPAAHAAGESGRATQATTPPEEAPSPTLPSDQVGLSHLKEAWPAVMQEVGKRSKRVWGLLNPSRPRELEGDVLVVEVQSDFHRSTMGDERNRTLLAEAVHAALGIRPGVSFDSVPARGAKPSVTHEVADLAESSPLESVKHDPVELLKAGFGAEVVEDTEHNEQKEPGRR
jgi:DNA polymerase-3 subunit gamma/tau